MAATSSSARVSSGSAATRRWKLSTSRAETSAPSGSPNPPASSRGSSSSASGLPCASATIRSRTGSSSGPWIADASSARASLVPSPRTTRSGSPAQPSLARRRAHRDDHPDRLGQQPARHERQRLRRGAVEPLGVVDQADQRLLAPDLGQQPEQRQADQEAIRRRARAQAERGAQRVALGVGQRVEPVEHRRAQLLQRGERQPGLGLHARGARDAAIGRPLGHVGQQRRLADPRLAAQHQRPALAGAHRVQQPVERFALAVTAQEHQGPNLHRPGAD